MSFSYRMSLELQNEFSWDFEFYSYEDDYLKFRRILHLLYFP